MEYEWSEKGEVGCVGEQREGWVEGCVACYDHIKDEKHLKISHQSECVEKPRKYEAVKKKCEYCLLYSAI